MAYQIRTIVAGVLEADVNDPVLKYALELSGRLEAACHLVHAYRLQPEPLGFPAADPSGAAASVLALDQQRYRDLEESLRSRLEASVPAAMPGESRPYIHVIAGSAHEAITRIAEEVNADLVILGATRRSRLREAFLGTNVSRTLHGARRPVLVLREPPHQPDTRVLLTTDLSLLSADACAAAMEVSRVLFGESVTFRCLLVVASGLGDLPPLDAARLRGSASEALGEFIARLPGPADVAATVRLGDPPAEIADEADAWDADVITLGTHSRAGAARLILGSVAEAVLRDARRTGLVLPVFPPA